MESSRVINLKDVTFLIRVRVDSMDRLENLLMVIDFITRHFDTNVHILETGSHDNHVLRKLFTSKQVQIDFIEDYDPVYHYTKHMNTMVKACHTPFVAVWEADIIIPPGQIMQSVLWLRRREADFVSPYKDKALDTTRIIRELYFNTKEVKILQENKGKMIELYSPNPVGGGFLANKDAYIHAGMENEKFYGWGREDGERINRWQILGYSYKRVPGPLFHLTHNRGLNSRFHSPKQEYIKSSEVFRLYAMSKEEMKAEIETWQ